jgi:tryptophan-rich sensory protein
MNDARPWPIAIPLAGAVALAVAVMGATITDLGPWYHMLRQPDWAPPYWAYGVIWTTIYALTAVAAVAAWTATDTRRAAETLIGLFALNGFLNILWSLLFFRFHRPDWAAVEAVALWLSVFALVIGAGRHARAAGLLLLPYLGWVSVALALNIAVVHLNGPFV